MELLTVWTVSSFYMETEEEMEESKIVLEMKDGRIDMDMEHVTVGALLVMCGAMQAMAGRYMMEHGAEMEEVKDNLLDIFLASMEDMQRSEGDQKWGN